MEITDGQQHDAADPETRGHQKVDTEPADGVPGSHDALLRVVEHLALLFVDAGLPRMSARVFAYVLAEDRDRYTARDLAEGLQVSPAAISGAVQQLVQMGFLAKEREPGLRSDLYRVYDDDVWAAIMTQQEPMLKRYEDVLRDCVTQLGPTRGGNRLA
ncbi:GbsR/MarR family transcriptional regulator, partial [Phytoactinopolyspora endophytica]|uniref:GbsR/MarR family transcriptional regulator n=1 Tax=Phytoactinopolyspora endophytica TaxID=1642495 RepID=UPI00197B725C